MKILNGLTKETYGEFSKRTNNANVLSFVRKDKETDKGGIWFGNKQYGVADFDSTDGNILTTFTDFGGLDINQNLNYDYSFTILYNEGSSYQKLLYLPSNGTYTFLVEVSCNGNVKSGYLNVGLYGISQNSYTIGMEGFYAYIGEGSTFTLCYPSKGSTHEPRLDVKLKLVGSSLHQKKNVIVYDNEFVQAYYNKRVTPIPCLISNNSTTIINSADTNTTYTTTATQEDISTVCEIITSGAIENYVINTDNVSNQETIVCALMDDKGVYADFPNGVYRFKFSTSMYGGVSVEGLTKNYDFTEPIIKNSILSLSVSDDYSEWSLDKPNIYSTDESISVDMDEEGGFDLTTKGLSGVTINGSSENITITDNVADLQMLFSNAGFYNNALVCAYYGSRDRNNTKTCLQPLFTARVQDNNSFKFSIRFRLCAVSSYHRSWQSEYYFDALNVDNDSPYQTLACLDFHTTDFGEGGASYIGGNNLASMYDVFYTTEKTFNSKGIEEWIVKFYKLHLSGFDMFAMLVDWVMDGNVQVDFHSMAYQDTSKEAIRGSILGHTWKSDDERVAKFDSPVQYTHSLSVRGEIKDLIGDKKIYYPMDFREGSANIEYSGLNTTNKTIVGAINELAEGSGGGIVDIQLNGGTTIVNPTTNIATINNVSAITIDNQSSTSALTSVKSVVDYVNSQKGTLRSVGCMGTSLKKLIEVQPKNNTTFYRITAMIMGGSQNPDFYGMMELTFGYNSPNNYCIAKWICYDKGKITFSCPNPPEIHIYKKKDETSIVIAGKCPDSAYQYCGLYIMTEMTDEATTTYYNEGATFSNYATNYTEVAMETLLVTDVQDSNGNSLVNKTNGIATITNSGGSGITNITINQSSEGVSIEDKTADLTIKDWTDEINFLSGRIDTLINSLSVTPPSEGGGGGGSGKKEQAIWEEISAITAQLFTLNLKVQNMKVGASAVTYSDGRESYKSEIDNNNVIDLGVIKGGGGSDNYAYIDESGEWLNIWSKKDGAYTKIAVSTLRIEV